MDICERYGAYLTIMPEIGELWAFEKSENEGFRKKLGYNPAIRIRQQLIEAIQRGHDVQLHVHPQWINARWYDERWELDYEHYYLTDFEHSETVSILRRGKEYLENLLLPYCPEYECIGFRAGHWNTQPSEQYLSALQRAGLKSDTSVFKGGFANKGTMKFDYRYAYSNVRAWYARMDDINLLSSGKSILEVPIATESVCFLSMLTLKRLWIAKKYLRDDKKIFDCVQVARGVKKESFRFIYYFQKLFSMHPKKLDFCKLTASEMLNFTRNLMEECYNHQRGEPIPIVMIGHSNQLISTKDMRKFLNKVDKFFNKKINFSTYRKFISVYENHNSL